MTFFMMETIKSCFEENVMVIQTVRPVSTVRQEKSFFFLGDIQAVGWVLLQRAQNVLVQTAGMLFFSLFTSPLNPTHQNIFVTRFLFVSTFRKRERRIGRAHV